MTDVTRILSAMENGDPAASDQLLPLVYDELRKLAAARMNQEKPGQTLQATELVHDAYLRLVDAKQVQNWNSRGHFFAAASEAMRRILVERARKRDRVRHGGGRQKVQLDDNLAISVEIHEDLLALDAALSEFEELEPEKAALVKLRYFGGMTIDEAAEIMQISRTTAKRRWAFARAWLLAKLDDPENS